MNGLFILGYGLEKNAGNLASMGWQNGLKVNGIMT